MQVINQKKTVTKLVSAHKGAGEKIGFVPTMGALHKGHLSLVKKAREVSDLVVVSIFVNPTQFEKPRDLEKYPRFLENDLEILKKNYPTVVVFTPTAEEMYGQNPVSKQFEFGALENVMEGKYRTGHFDGVATVLTILFDIVQPDAAFFGEKDFQQLQIVRKLVEITKRPIDIIGCPIAREPNGLARSSRNERLSGLQRSEAGFIYKTLQEAKAYFGTKNATFISNWVVQQFRENPYLELEYFIIADAKTLKPIENKKENVSYRAFIAVYAGEVRLIDNIALN